MTNCKTHGNYQNPHGCPICRMEFAGRKWYEMNIGERRRALEDADLWDGNTYAMAGWNALPHHIRQDLTNAISVTEGDKQRYEALS